MNIVEEIVIHAPAQRVFDALADADQRRQWWGGERFKLVSVSSDLRVGGRWSMRFEAYGRNSGMEGEYRVIEPPRVLEFTWHPDWYENASISLVRFELEEREGATHVRLTHSDLVTEADRTNHRGWGDILAWLRGYVQGHIDRRGAPRG
ncbi:MAG: SRPBCC family protein [Terriglobales bacterium]